RDTARARRTRAMSGSARRARGSRSRSSYGHRRRLLGAGGIAGVVLVASTARDQPDHPDERHEEHADEHDADERGHQIADHRVIAAVEAVSAQDRVAPEAAELVEPGRDRG